MISALSKLDLVNGEFDEHLLLKEIGRINTSVCHIPSVLVSRNNNSIDTKFKQIDVSKGLTIECTETIYPKVSIIIPTCLSDMDMVDRCFAGLNNLTDYPDMEVIIVVNNVRDGSVIKDFLSKWTFKVIHWEGSFNWSGINNFGAAHATGEYLLFMNDDVEPLDRNWLKIMVNTLTATGAGIVGSLLKYPNGSIQHLGVNFVNYGGGARHLFRFCSGYEQNLQWLMNYPREVSAVTGACLLTTSKCLNIVGGFDEKLPLVCNDTDFCLRVNKSGYSVIIQPQAILIHHEGVSRAGMPEVEDVDRFWGKWDKFLKDGDQFTNPNLDATRDDWAVNPDVMEKFRYRISNRSFKRANLGRIIN
jgi:GT2 family glycosyltransferase